MEFKIGETVIVKAVSDSGRRINQKLAGLIGPITDIQQSHGQTFIWVELPGHCQSYCWFRPEDLLLSRKSRIGRAGPHMEANLAATMGAWEAIPSSITDPDARQELATQEDAQPLIAEAGAEQEPATQEDAQPSSEQFNQIAKWLAEKEEEKRKVKTSWPDIKVTMERKEVEPLEYLRKFAHCERDPHGKSAHEPGAKMDAGKIQAGILLDFGRALLKVAEVGTYGANKYTRGGWQEVPDGQQRYLDALMRHLCKMTHEPVDKDSGLLSLAQVAWNALAVLELSLREDEA